MEKRRARIVIAAIAAFALFAVISPGKRAEIRILTHEKGDLSPHRMQAAIDIGLFAISVLYTWTDKLSR